MNKIEKISKDLLDVINNLESNEDKTYTLTHEDMLKLMDIECIAWKIGQEVNQIYKKMVVNYKNRFLLPKSQEFARPYVYKKHWVFKFLAWFFIVYGVITFGILLYFIIHIKEIFQW